MNGVNIALNITYPLPMWNKEAILAPYSQDHKLTQLHELHLVAEREAPGCPLLNEQ